MSDLIDRQAAIDGKICIRRSNGVEIYDDYVVPVEYLEQLPPAQPEQLEQCPIYGGMCAYPSYQCYDCPRHAGAKMEVTT